jgi:para-nitrobenzyl esterase
LTNASLAALALPARRLFGVSLPTPVTVRTSSGILRGESDDGIRVFRGVPFAQPPVGPLRFRRAMPVKSWKGKRDATRFSAAPMQWHEPPPPGEASLSHSEDCLYLNIWTPEGKARHPVFVWIHGGGFIGGHAFAPIFDGTEFAREDIVVVTVAYRLGIFGFLDFGPLLGPDYAGTGNNALSDLIAALEWIQRNIAAFGGDPARVTVGGESAGAKLTDILMGVPSAQALFHQMISESGGAERVWTKDNAAFVANGFGDQWRKQTGKDLPSLLTAAPDLLVESQREFFDQWPRHFPLRAEVDGQVLPQLPVKTIAAGSTRGKRLLIGTNRDESAAFIGPHPASDPAPKDLGNLSVAKFEPVFRRYEEIYPDMIDFKRRVRAVTAEEYWIPSVRVADAHLQGGGDAFVYRLDFSESSGRLGGFAYHSLDVPLVWDHPHNNATNFAAEAALAKQIHAAWAAFIRGETPAAPGLPPWPQYSTTTRPTMILDTESRVEQKPAETELRLWDTVL